MTRPVPVIGKAIRLARIEQLVDGGQVEVDETLLGPRVPEIDQLVTPRRGHVKLGPKKGVGESHPAPLCAYMRRNEGEGLPCRHRLSKIGFIMCEVVTDGEDGNKDLERES